MNVSIVDAAVFQVTDTGLMHPHPSEDRGPFEVEIVLTQKHDSWYYTAPSRECDEEDIEFTGGEPSLPEEQSAIARANPRDLAEIAIRELRSYYYPE